MNGSTVDCEHGAVAVAARHPTAVSTFR